MWELSENTRTLIDRLPECSTLRIRPTRDRSRSDTATSLITRIGQTAEPAAIFYLRDWVLDADAAIREAAAAAIHLLVQQLRPRDYVQLDLQSRAFWHMSPRWNESLTPSRTRALLHLGVAATSVLGLATCHSDGRVREEAAAMLDQFGEDGSELPFLLLRCNDWVAQVRTRNLKSILARMRPEYAEHFLRNIVLVRRLEDCARAEHTGLVRKVRHLLASELARDVLRRGADSTDYIVRRESWGLAFDAGHEPFHELVIHAMQDSDNMVRLQAVRQGVHRLDGQRLSDLLNVVVQDRFIPVRREALGVLVERFPDKASSELERALLDSQHAIREFARFYLRGRMTPGDIHSFYLRATGVESGRRLCAAAAGLGETGEPQDAAALVPFLTHASPRLRRTAIRAIARLARDTHLSEIVSALGDASASVSRTAARILRFDMGQACFSQVCLLMRTTTHRLARKYALELIASRNTWKTLPILLDSCRDLDEEGSSHACALLDGWLGCSHMPSGSSDDLSRALESLDQTRAILPARSVRLIEFMLEKCRARKP